MINSKKLKTLTEKLSSLDNIIGILNSGSPVEMEFTGSSGVYKVRVHTSSDNTSSYDLSKDLSKSFTTMRGHVEREIRGLVRP
jgi:hypothetical protein